MVDNTFLGPLWQHPLAHGADIVLYSATKYIGGHSDLIAGAALGSTERLAQHPASITHAGVDPQDKARLDVTDSLTRLSVGIETPDEIIVDLANTLETV